MTSLTIKQNKAIEKELTALKEQKSNLVLKLTSGVVSDKDYKFGVEVINNKIIDKQAIIK
ncbi:MAG: hypothetical protein LBS61_02285 [Endomicrobium sp.]|nr:hypothetical protein [Endomicrobium sp.]